MKHPRIVGLCALGLLLLFCGPSTWVESALGADTIGLVYLEIKVPEPVYANEPFSITLQVTRDPVVYDRAYGRLYNETGQIGDEFVIRFFNHVWNSSIKMSFSAGPHTLRFWVRYLYDTESEGTDSVETSVVAQERLPSYTVEWLHHPDEPIRAGKLIRLRFSIRDSSLSFVRSDDVRIVVEDMNGNSIVSATCGSRSGSIRINSGREYYRWYWKTGRDLQEGEYYVFVLLDGANLLENSIQIRIVS